ncbi:MAG: hypothetical protein E6G57_14725 [Actinobacteria bacterium]|nr:MAG: hypothetical protein E6G57_14725 [Actinomycetota bacterium]
MRSKQVVRGSLRWLPPDEGGLKEPFRLDTWCRPAWIEPGDIHHVASLVITGIEPQQPVSPSVEAYWLAWEKIPGDEWTLRPGDVLAVTNGPRCVAHLTVESVEAAS